MILETQSQELNSLKAHQSPSLLPKVYLSFLLFVRFGGRSHVKRLVPHSRADPTVSGKGIHCHTWGNIKIVFKLTHCWHSNFPHLGSSQEIAPLHQILGLEGQAWLRLWGSHRWGCPCGPWVWSQNCGSAFPREHQSSGGPDLPQRGGGARGLCADKPLGVLMMLQFEDSGLDHSSPTKSCISWLAKTSLY